MSLIDPCWCLTAAHSAVKLEPGHEVRFGSVVRCISRVVLHPSWYSPPQRLSRAAIVSLAHLALLKLGKPVVGIEPLRVYQGLGEVGSVAMLLGNGTTGTGLTGGHSRDGVWRAAKFFLAGVASWEDSNDAKMRGGYCAWKFFVRLAAYRSWIEEVVATREV